MSSNKVYTQLRDNPILPPETAFILPLIPGKQVNSYLTGLRSHLRDKRELGALAGRALAELLSWLCLSIILPMPFVSSQTPQTSLCLCQGTQEAGPTLCSHGRGGEGRQVVMTAGAWGGAVECTTAPLQPLSLLPISLLRSWRKVGCL